MEKKITLITNDQYLGALLKVLDRAKKQIDILSFSFAIGTSNGKINTKSSPYIIAQKIKDLKLKHGKKLRVRFFVEGLRETADRNSITGKFLEDAGVEVVYGSTHAKGFCIDGRFILFGSTNLTQQSIIKNNEANLLIDDKKIAKGFTEYFEHLWNGGGHGEIELSPPLLADGAFKDVLIDMIDRSKKSVSFAIYFFNYKEISDALIRAHDRGVKVSGFVHQHLSFALSYIYANRRTVKNLRERGLTEIYFSVPNKFSHSKYLVIDNMELLLGTGNWLKQDVFIHPQLYIHLKNSIVARELAKNVKWLIKKESTTD